MEREIQPVQPVEKTKAVRGIRPVKLHRRPRTESKLKPNIIKSRIAPEQQDSKSSIDNHAHHTPEHVGECVDFKV